MSDKVRELINRVLGWVWAHPGTHFEVLTYGQTSKGISSGIAWTRTVPFVALSSEAINTGRSFSLAQRRILRPCW